MNKNANNDFIIPEKFLKQLEEFANGGFILLTFSRNGNPVAHHAYESRKDQLAIEAFLESYSEKISRERFQSEENATSSKNEENETEDDGDDSEEKKRA